jgi:TolA-binding protein
MKTNRIALVTLVALAATVTAASAGVVDTRRNDLRATQQKLAWRAQNSKGVHGQELRREERKLDSMIDDLEHGRSVDPHEIDRALEHSERGAF